MKIGALHWFTSDLRVGDNAALAAGAGRGPVAGVFVLDPASLRRAADAPRRVGFMRACIASLADTLAAGGSRLIILEGDPVEEVPRLAAGLGAPLVTHARNVEPAARRRERDVARALARDGVEVASADAASVHPQGTLRTGTDGAYLVYGPFARAWSVRRLPEPAREPRSWVRAADLAGGIAVDTTPAGGLPAAGETAAGARLASFIRSGLGRYADRRDVPAEDGTSRLSYHLRFGTLSAADACRRVRAAVARRPALRCDAEVWLRELAWRDFFTQLLAEHPHVARRSFRPLPVRWRIDDAAFRRWQEGTTGYPMVDAGMRELAATGWMHNRARMLTASFLTRHLLVDWRLGERHFAALLLDAQLSQNNGNWQWVAGTGADAQPGHRVFSPVRQGERFDPEGDYVRRWIPEIARVPARSVHAPWTLGRAERRALCPDYPPPVVDLEMARGRALAAYAGAVERRRAGRS
jgi:deoxyribodipyrimidine photo-lyase